MPEVNCIHKTNRQNAWERIEYIGGVNADGTRWKLSQQKAIEAIEKGTYGEFYVNRPLGDRVKVIVAVSRFGNKYVKTEADRDEPNNPLSLPECP